MSNTIHECDKCGMYFRQDEGGVYWHPCEQPGLSPELLTVIGVILFVVFAVVLANITW